MEHLIRRVRAAEWTAVRELRLAALQDPVAHLAYLETYALAVARPDVYWQGRAEQCASGGTAAQFVAVRGDGGWDGSVTSRVEEPGTTDFAGLEVPVRQAHLVGVFVRPEVRGRGVTEELFRAAAEWSWREAEVERIRLFVHEDNARAIGFYLKAGFRPSGVLASISGTGEQGGREREFVKEL